MSLRACNIANISLIENNFSQAQIDKIKPTGRHGMLTKGDVLAAMGKVSNPYGSAEKLLTDPMGPSGKRKSEPKGASAAPAAKPEPPLDGPALRRLIVQGLTKAAAPVVSKEPTTASAQITDAEFDDLLADYSPLVPAPAPAAAPAAPAAAPKDELEGLI